MEATMRRFMYHSPLGGGASMEQQIDRRRSDCEKRVLPERLQSVWEELWKVARKSPPKYHS